jgi:hypothetical protein
MRRERLFKEITFESTSAPGFRYPTIHQEAVDSTHVGAPRVERRTAANLIDDIIPICGD